MDYKSIDLASILFDAYHACSVLFFCAIKKREPKVDGMSSESNVCRQVLSVIAPISALDIPLLLLISALMHSK
jgi:hypothetical protein